MRKSIIAELTPKSGIPEKNINWGVEDILSDCIYTFLKKTPQFLDLPFYRKQDFTPGKSAKLCDDTPWWKLQVQKPRTRPCGHFTMSLLWTPLEIPILVSFFRNFHMLSIQQPWTVHVLNSPCFFICVWTVFSGIAHCSW